MPAPDQVAEDASAVARDIAEIARCAGLTVAAAESLTSGAIASRLGAAPGASSWFRGGVAAYSDLAKREVLGVPPGPVVSEATARAMARGVAQLLGADIAVAVTGVGGPAEQEDQPVGTVWFGVVVGDDSWTEQRRFNGEADDILRATTLHALELLREAARLRAT